MADCLRSLAYQMALGDNTVRARLRTLIHDRSVARNPIDGHLVWPDIFEKGIFARSDADSGPRHIWIIDGLDECSDVDRWMKLLPLCVNHVRIFVSSLSEGVLAGHINTISARLQHRLCRIELLKSDKIGKGAGVFFWVILPQCRPGMTALEPSCPP